MNRRKILWMVGTCLIALSLIMASCGKAAITITPKTTATATTSAATTVAAKSTTTPTTVTFEQKRTDVITYLRAFNDIDNSAGSVASTIVFPSSVNTAADLIAWNAAVTKFLTVLDGAISRLSELKPSSLEASTSTHLQQARSFYQSQRTILKALQDAVSTGNAAGILQKANELAASSSSASLLNRATEQLMLQYNISDAEVNYSSRGK